LTQIESQSQGMVGTITQKSFHLTPDCRLTHNFGTRCKPSATGSSREDLGPGYWNRITQGECRVIAHNRDEAIGGAHATLAAVREALGASKAAHHPSRVARGLRHANRPGRRGCLRAAAGGWAV